ncbi:MAG: hypothetical protein ACOH2F_16200 [Cellulomonas sp.]
MSDIPAGSVDPTSHPEPGRGVRSVILGALLAVLAPLFGFLGGTMAGTAGSLDTLDPLVVWLVAGMAIGAIGVAIAIRGGLLWVRANYSPPR